MAYIGKFDKDKTYIVGVLKDGKSPSNKKKQDFDKSKPYIAKYGQWFIDEECRTFQDFLKVNPFAWDTVNEYTCYEVNEDGGEEGRPRRERQDFVGRGQFDYREEPKEGFEDMSQEYPKRETTQGLADSMAETAKQNESDNKVLGQLLNSLSAMTEKVSNSTRADYDKQLEQTKAMLHDVMKSKDDMIAYYKDALISRDANNDTDKLYRWIEQLQDQLKSARDSVDMQLAKRDEYWEEQVDNARSDSDEEIETLRTQLQEKEQQNYDLMKEVENLKHEIKVNTLIHQSKAEYETQIKGLNDKLSDFKTESKANGLGDKLSDFIMSEQGAPVAVALANGINQLMGIFANKAGKQPPAYPPAQLPYQQQAAPPQAHYPVQPNYAAPPQRSSEEMERIILQQELIKKYENSQSQEEQDYWMSQLKPDYQRRYDWTPDSQQGMNDEEYENNIDGEV